MRDDRFIRESGAELCKIFQDQRIVMAGKGTVFFSIHRFNIHVDEIQLFKYWQGAFPGHTAGGFDGGFQTVCVCLLQ